MTEFKDKMKFIQNRHSLISVKFLEQCHDLLSVEDFETLCKAESFNIELSINGIKMDFGTVDEIIEHIYDRQESLLINNKIKEVLKTKYIPEKLQEKLFRLTENLNELDSFIDNLPIVEEDGFYNVMYE